MLIVQRLNMVKMLILLRFIQGFNGLSVRIPPGVSIEI